MDSFIHRFSSNKWPRIMHKHSSDTNSTISMTCKRSASSPATPYFSSRSYIGSRYVAMVVGFIKSNPALFLLKNMARNLWKQWLSIAPIFSLYRKQTAGRKEASHTLPKPQTSHIQKQNFATILVVTSTRSNSYQNTDMRQNQFSIPYSTLSIVHRDIPAEIYYPFHPISRRRISTTAPLYVSGTLITTTITTIRCQNSQKTPSSVASTAPGNSNSWREQEKEEQEESGEGKNWGKHEPDKRESLQLLLVPTTRRCEYKQISDGKLHRFFWCFSFFLCFRSAVRSSSKREAA